LIQTVADQLRIELSKTKKKMPTPTAASATTAITTAITTTNSGNIIPNMPKGAKAAEVRARSSLLMQRAAHGAHRVAASHQFCLSC
jgi:hypothetical protein